ncbi:hypothetical protein XACLE20_440023 [Xanthomonas citri pv. citri]|nr:hypothetical protein XACLE20_440023 [Xanthomonas citri pv. citri]CEH37994.1 hypothetical protein XACLE3_2350010 [Xanthomonas citri pv. citri]
MTLDSSSHAPPGAGVATVTHARGHCYTALLHPTPPHPAPVATSSLQKTPSLALIRLESPSLHSKPFNSSD